MSATIKKLIGKDLIQKSLIGIFTILALNLGTSGEVATGDLGPVPFITAAFAEAPSASATDFDALRGQADTALRTLTGANGPT